LTETGPLLIGQPFADVVRPLLVMTPVGTEVDFPVPELLVAVTRTRSVCPTSLLAGV
jgi:hypothetical protein